MKKLLALAITLAALLAGNANAADTCGDTLRAADAALKAYKASHHMVTIDDEDQVKGWHDEWSPKIKEACK